jgi:flagellin FlaB
MQKTVNELNRLPKLIKGESGLTGLETAIILIAFVTVAAVFAYSTLSAGFFATQKESETIYGGLDQSRTNMEGIGAIIATSTDNMTVSSVRLSIRNGVAGKPMDLTPNDGTGQNKVVISLTSSETFYNDIRWSCVPVGNHNGNYILEPGEQFDILLDMNGLGGTYLNPSLGKYDTLTIQLKPALGSTLTIERSLPSQIKPVMNLW